MITEGEKFSKKYGRLRERVLREVGGEIKGFLPAMKKVVEVAIRSQLKGERVKAKEKVFSIFEPHTELIMQAKLDNPCEFGHKIILSESKEKFILDFFVMEKARHDSKI